MDMRTAGWIGLALGVAGLSGCQATSEFVESTKPQQEKFAEAAKKEAAEGLQKALTADYQSEFERLKVQAGEARDKVQQASDLTDQILASHGIDVKDRKWVETQLATGSETVRDAMRPLLLEIAKHEPTMRLWALELVEKEIKRAEGDRKKQWEDTKSEIQKAK